MIRSPVDRRGHIAQPYDRPPARSSKRRHSQEPRGRERRRGSPPPSYFQQPPKTIREASFDEVERMAFPVPEDPFEHPRRAVERAPRLKHPNDRVRVVHPDDVVREGIVFEYANYFEFLRSWLDECNRVLLKKSRTAMPKTISEEITPTSRAERARIILPAGVFDRSELLHCDMIIEGLPPSVFFGSGFGHKASLARGAAAKDLVDKCFRVGLLTEVLHSSIGNHPFFKRKDLPRKEYDLAVDALLDLDRKISTGTWPWDLNTARELEPETLDRLKTVFKSVVEDIYLARPREPAREEHLHRSTAPNGPMPPFVGGREEEEFCRRCRAYGHLERYCQANPDRGRERARPRSPVHGPRSPRDIPPNRDEIYRERDVYEKEKLHYTSDEIAQKIARQREELLRQEMMLRRSEEGESWPIAGAASQPLVSTPRQQWNGRGRSLGIHGAIEPLFTSISPPDEPLLNERQLRMARDEELRAKLEAKAQKLEEDKHLKQKEEELERRMQRELEAKKIIMEEEIRKKVQLEERAKLQIQLAQTQQAAPAMPQQAFPPFSGFGRTNSNYPSLYPPAFASSAVTPGNGGFANGTYSSTPDFEMEEIKRLIKETEEKLQELQRNCRESELSSIFKSRAFQVAAELGDNAYLLDRHQKQKLLSELKEILNTAGKRERERRESERRRSRSRSRERRSKRTSHDRERHSYRRSRSRSPRGRVSSYKHGIEEERFTETRVNVGGVTLRNLPPIEQRALKVNEYVYAKDTKTGTWTTARIVKISDDRATLTIGNTTWKKDLNELYKEVPQW